VRLERAGWYPFSVIPSIVLVVVVVLVVGCFWVGRYKRPFGDAIAERLALYQRPEKRPRTTTTIRGSRRPSAK
jgi:hypothetical protein